MEESKKKRIVIASVLKPVDDTRMFGKMATSLAHAGYDVHVIGYPTSLTNTLQEICKHPSKPFKRLSLKRLFRPIVVFKKIWHLRPVLIIINTHELLFVAVIIKLTTRCKVIYDLQENYFRNILHTKSFIIWSRPILAFYVRTKEFILSPVIDHFILAESGYEKELTFLPKRKTIIENKLKKSDKVYRRRSREDGLIHLLFSGTLAQTTGVFQAIDMAEKLHRHNQSIRLTIIGYCAQHNVFKHIQLNIKDKNFITLIGGDSLVPHTRILQAIQQCDFGIISYPPNVSTQNSYPTKLYEYLGYELPILLTDHAPWIDQCKPYAAAIAINFQQINVNDILHQMENKSFYTSKPNNVFWDDECFLNLIDKILL